MKEGTIARGRTSASVRSVLNPLNAIRIGMFELHSYRSHNSHTHVNRWLNRRSVYPGKHPGEPLTNHTCRSCYQSSSRKESSEYLLPPIKKTSKTQAYQVAPSVGPSRTNGHENDGRKRQPHPGDANVRNNIDPRNKG
ncbi:hypothetical protein LXL04_024054 [Taraxacum kok-saghyz]